jgi:hypothetical protein
MTLTLTTPDSNNPSYLDFPLAGRGIGEAGKWGSARYRDAPVSDAMVHTKTCYEH